MESVNKKQSILVLVCAEILILLVYLAPAGTQDIFSFFEKKKKKFVSIYRSILQFALVEISMERLFLRGLLWQF